ncbi:unnamed protein product [Rhodiola kirilowii]
MHHSPTLLLLLIFITISNSANIFVCTDAIRLLDRISSSSASTQRKHQKNSMIAYEKLKKSKDVIFSKYFPFKPASSSSYGGKEMGRDQKGGFVDSERRVPSCPDSLHNK